MDREESIAKRRGSVVYMASCSERFLPVQVFARYRPNISFENVVLIQVLMYRCPQAA